MTDTSTRPESAAGRRARMRAEVETITSLLQDRVQSLAPVLLPDGHRAGTDWRDGDHGVRSIRLTGPTAGVYRDFREPKGTDMLGAVQALLTNGDFKAALAWSRSWLGIEAGGDPAALELARDRARTRRIEAEARAERDAEERGRKAGQLWHGAGPILGSPADTYLAGRGIRLDRLARPPGALRYAPAVWCKTRCGEHPAMVSGLWRIGKPKLRAAHRTFLAPAGDGWGKADVDPVRSILGSWPGAIVPIQRGESGARWTDIPEGELVAFGEGIEEGLSIALVKPAWRVGAVGFVGGFGAVELPVWCHVLLCVNNDAEDSPATRAIEGDARNPGAVRELEARGHVVRVMRPPPEFADWNDFLRGVRRGR